MQKLGADNRTKAIAITSRRGIISWRSQSTPAQGGFHAIQNLQRKHGLKVSELALGTGMFGSFQRPRRTASGRLGATPR
jgi:hypothetical protein